MFDLSWTIGSCRDAFNQHPLPHNSYPKKVTEIYAFSETLLINPHTPITPPLTPHKPILWSGPENFMKLCSYILP